MAKSKEYIQGYKDALKAYSWIGNDKLIRIGLPGILLNTVIAKIESELELDIPAKSIQKEPEEKELSKEEK